LFTGKNNTQSSVYVMWDDAKSVAGPTFAGVQLGVNPPAAADAAADAIAAAHAEQAAAAAAAAGAQEGDFLTDLGGDYEEFRQSLGALGVLQ
jgi:hypothetical protein